MINRQEVPSLVSNYSIASQNYILKNDYCKNAQPSKRKTQHDCLRQLDSTTARFLLTSVD